MSSKSSSKQVGMKKRDCAPKRKKGEVTSYVPKIFVYTLLEKMYLYFILFIDQKEREKYQKCPYQDPARECTIYYFV